MKIQVINESDGDDMLSVVSSYETPQNEAFHVTQWFRWIFGGGMRISEELARNQRSLRHLQEQSQSSVEGDLAKLDESIHQELEEIRGEKEVRSRRVPSGRPFTALRTIAEVGEQMQRSKNA